MNLYEANQQLHELLNREIVINQQNESNSRRKDRDILKRDQEIARKDTAIEKLNNEIQNRENIIKKLRRELYKAKKENKENCIHINQCESIIAELRESVTKLKNRIHELYSNKISYTPITMSVFRTAVEYIDALLDAFSDHFNRSNI